MRVSEKSEPENIVMPRASNGTVYVSTADTGLVAQTATQVSQVLLALGEEEERHAAAKTELLTKLASLRAVEHQLMHVLADRYLSGASVSADVYEYRPEAGAFVVAKRGEI